MLLLRRLWWAIFADLIHCMAHSPLILDVTRGNILWVQRIAHSLSLRSFFERANLAASNVLDSICLSEVFTFSIGKCSKSLCACHSSRYVRGSQALRDSPFLPFRDCFGFIAFNGSYRSWLIVFISNFVSRIERVG